MRRIKAGIVIGLVAMPVNLVISVLFGICGPVVTLVAGGVSGFLASQGERSWPRSAGAQAGAVSGGLVGLLLLLTQTLGALGAVLVLQATGTAPLFGTMPQAGETGQQILFLGSALATGMCFGVVGIAAGAAAGALGGWLGSSAPQGGSGQ